MELVDKGAVIFATLTQLRRLPPQFTELDPQALRCSWASIRPLVGGVWTDAARDRVRNLLLPPLNRVLQVENQPPPQPPPSGLATLFAPQGVLAIPILTPFALRALPNSLRLTARVVSPSGSGRLVLSELERRRKEEDAAAFSIPATLVDEGLAEWSDVAAAAASRPPFRAPPIAPTKEEPDLEELLADVL